MRVIPVAVGILRDAGGRVLVQRRPAGTLAAGRWEFPGGKIEAGEDAADALRRELAEELGIAAGNMRPLHHLRHDYGDRIVELRVLEVADWQGVPRPREGQGLAWQAPAALYGIDLLEADWPIVSALRLPPLLAVSPDLTDPAACAGWLECLLDGGHLRLARLRLPSLDDGDYARIAAQLVPRARAAGCGLLLDRDPALVADTGAAGWHASAKQLTALRGRPALPPGSWFSAAAHDRAEMDRAIERGADFLLLGPVLDTATHPGAAALGWSGFSALVDACPLPVYGIGGLGPDALETMCGAGGIGVAGIRAFASAP